jgi:hypothetical protein
MQEIVMKRKWVIGICIAGFVGTGIVAGSIILLVAGIFALTRPVVDASEEFLALLGQGKTAEAYASTAGSFRARHDENSFKRAVEQLGLSEFASVSWHSRQIQNLDGLAEGTVVTREGSSKPVSVQLIREGTRWTVVGLQFGGIDLTSVTAPPGKAGATE